MLDEFLYFGPKLNHSNFGSYITDRRKNLRPLTQTYIVIKIKKLHGQYGSSSGKTSRALKIKKTL